MLTCRSWLFTPGHRSERVEKALGLTADAVILDLEDGVPPADRDRAREGIAGALERSGDARPALYVRIQGVRSVDLEADLAASVRAGIAGLVVPKVREPEEIGALDHAISVHEGAFGLAPGTVRLIALIETALGLVNVAQIAGASPRLAGLMLGTEDLAAELGLWSVPANEEFLYARSAVAIAAAGQGLAAIDRVYTDFRDAEGLRSDAARGRALGFTGKAVIHPTQIELANAAFSPTSEDVRAAREVIRLWEEAGGGAVAIRGKMADEPVVARARRVLALQRREEERGE